MSDLIRITGIRAWGRHGVFEAERRDGQEFVVDIELAVDTSTAAETDDLADTVDYSRIAGEAADVITGDPVDLIETLAARIAALCLSNVGVDQASVTVHKPSAPLSIEVRDVSVTITRSK